MKVLVIGSGGREHAIAYALSRSRSLEHLYILPGNPGTKLLGENVSLNPDDQESVSDFCRSAGINLVVIGPEKPLVDGLADILRINGFPVFGPGSSAARIEADKAFAKKLMVEAGIPTAGYKEFSSDNYNKAADYLKTHAYPAVIKANGLAAGKGVLICNNYNEAVNALNEIFIKKIFGTAGDKIVVEEFLKGEEASVFAITDGDNFICLPSSQDHKRIGDNDTGKNTGGMGAYSPAPVVTDRVMKEVEEKIVKPALSALKKSGGKFIGCLYCGLMITGEETRVVEFNCRFGDPETQVVLPLLGGDFLQLLFSAASGKLDKSAVNYSGGSAVCVVAASKGYPDAYLKGFPITGLEHQDPGIIVYHAGTAEQNGKIVTSGGRVLGITSVVAENNPQEAYTKAYEAIKKINFEGMYYRHDIASRILKR